LKGLTLSGRARGPGLSRQKREFGESGCSLLESAAGPRADIQNVTRGILEVYRIVFSLLVFISDAFRHVDIFKLAET